MHIIIKRLLSESPKLFKGIFKICVTLGVIGASIIAAGDTLPGYAIAAAPHLLVAGIIGAAVSKLTVEDKEKLNDGQ